MCQEAVDSELDMDAKSALFRYENLDHRFMMQAEDFEDLVFSRQYFNYYLARVASMRDRIVEQAKKEIDESVELSNLIGIKPNERVFTIGTVFKHMQMRPSVLKDMAKDDDEQELHLPDPLMADRLIAEDDFLQFEVDKQLVKLAGNINKNEYITGCVIGVYGYQTDVSDTFHVLQVITPSIPPQSLVPKHREDRYVAFLSGLQITGQVELDTDLVKALGSLRDFLLGVSANVDEHGDPYKIERLVIVGESIGLTKEGKQYSAAARYVTRNEQPPNYGAMQTLDTFVNDVTGSIPVDVMPGPSDPAMRMFPQQPIHKAVFPKSSHHGEMLTLCTNPHQFHIGEMSFLGTSGQNVADLMRLTSVEKNIDTQEHFLKWQHIAPSVPDTIDGFPFDRDPLIMNDTPHILFCGNQEEHEEKDIDLGEAKVRVIHIPRFSETRTIVMFNLRTWESHEVYQGTVGFTPLSQKRLEL